MKINSRFKLNISIKVAALLVISVIAIMLIVDSVSFVSEKSNRYKNLLSDSEQMIDRISNSLSDPLWNYDRARAETVVLLEMKNQNVMCVIVRKDNGTLYLGKAKNMTWDILTIDQESEVSVFRKQSFITTARGIDRVEENRFGIKGDKVYLGEVEVFFTDFYFKKHLRDLFSKFLIQTMTVFGMILLVLFFSLKFIILNPIIDLDKVVKRFSNKDFTVRAKIGSSDEVGELGRSFNEMAQALQQYSLNMEEIVAERTNDLKRANDKMKNDLVMAKRIQEAIIPKVFPGTRYFDIYGIYVPMEDLGGDYYDVIKLSETRIAVVIADVCGHGVPSALIASMARMAFVSKSTIYTKVNEVVSAVNNELHTAIGESGYYLTAFYCVIDIQKKTIEYTNASHNEIYILTKDRKIKAMKTNSPCLGVFKDVEFVGEEIEFSKSDKIVFYTDGITEARNRKSEMIDQSGFKNILHRNYEMNSKELVDKIMYEVNRHTEFSDADDDRTVLVIEVVNTDLFDELPPSSIKERQDYGRGE